ncbi:hypothetical protein IE53DRAFT_272413 [Violaceomyces palustris]|uniref:Uncharacterized protein n=1 Tax=Violaceomyces palustris TaxID=1673888 RepID=A0ACD0NMN8_9BASI|nr:hypothetical protein IE53DRAFT_272413 [Violaceomyces palustris]
MDPKVWFCVPRFPLHCILLFSFSSFSRPPHSTLPNHPSTFRQAPPSPHFSQLDSFTQSVNGLGLAFSWDPLPACLSSCARTWDALSEFLDQGFMRWHTLNERRDIPQVTQRWSALPSITTLSPPLFPLPRLTGIAGDSSDPSLLTSVHLHLPTTGNPTD